MIMTILADDHKLFCDGLERLLIASEKFQILAKYNSGNDLLESNKLPEADLLIIDIEMPGLNGFDTIKRVRLNNPTLKIIMLSMHEESVYSNEAYCIGADGFLFKSIDSTTLINRVIQINE